VTDQFKKEAIYYTKTKKKKKKKEEKEKKKEREEKTEPNSGTYKTNYFSDYSRGVVLYFGKQNSLGFL
jgi:hypothetical protein